MKKSPQHIYAGNPIIVCSNISSIDEPSSDCGKFSLMLEHKTSTASDLKTLRQDIPRTLFIGTSSNVGTLWIEAIKNKPYLQGMIDGGIYTALAMGPISCLWEENTLTIRFAYIDETGAHCGFSLSYLCNDPSSWVAAITRNTLACLEDIKLSFFDARKPMTDVRLWAQKIKEALNHSKLSSMIDILFDNDGMPNHRMCQWFREASDILKEKSTSVEQGVSLVRINDIFCNLEARYIYAKMKLESIAAPPVWQKELPADCYKKITYFDFTASAISVIEGINKLLQSTPLNGLDHKRFESLRSILQNAVVNIVKQSITINQSLTDREPELYWLKKEAQEECERYATYDGNHEWYKNPKAFEETFFSKRQAYETEIDLRENDEKKIINMRSQYKVETNTLNGFDDELRCLEMFFRGQDTDTKNALQKLLYAVKHKLPCVARSDLGGTYNENLCSLKKLKTCGFFSKTGRARACIKNSVLSETYRGPQYRV